MTMPVIITAEVASPVDLHQLQGRDDPLALPWAAKAVDLTALTAVVATTERTANKGQPSGYAELDSSGKIPTLQLPTLTFGQVFIDATQAAMLAESTAVPGAQSIRTDLDRTYILVTSPPSILGNWHLLPVGTSVTSWNGQTGIVTVPEDGAAGTPSLRTLGVGAQQAAGGTHTHTGTLDANARVAVAKAGSLVGTRRKISLDAAPDLDLAITDDSGSEVVNIYIKRYNILEGVHLTSIGDSLWTAVGLANTGGSSTLAGLAGARLAQRFGMQYINNPAGTTGDNRNVGGSRIQTIASRMIAAGPTGNAWLPGTDDARGVIFVSCVPNSAHYDGQQTGSILTTRANRFADTMRGICRYARAGAAPVSILAGSSGTGAWATVNDPAGTATPTSFYGGTETYIADQHRYKDNIQASTIGAPDIIVSGSRIDQGATYGFVDFYDQATFVNPNNPGPVVATLNCGDGWPNPDIGTTEPNWYQATVRLPNAYGRQYIAMTRDNNIAYLDCFWPSLTKLGNQFPPFVFFMHGGYAPAYGLNAAVDAYNAQVDAVCAEMNTEFGYDYCFPVPLIGWDPATCIHGTVHANERGQRVLVDSASVVLRQKVPDYIEGVHILT